MSDLTVAVLAIIVFQAIHIGRAEDFCLPQPYIYNHYVFGREAPGGVIGRAQTCWYEYEREQSRIQLTFNYNVRKGPISQILLFAETSEGGTSNAAIQSGGIGRNSVSLSVTGWRTNYLRFHVIVFETNNTVSRVVGNGVGLEALNEYCYN
ncbi:uncharacterized protein LOC142229595 [Haematobia irritans]|uniref:uncharacterized protein LOC142229595 n=1 Tax=Haematobia irritans TaxID=7368 RepID=UPI003F4FB88B